jgi:hypothetical protein
VNVEDSGFQGTAFTKNKATFGVHLFLNICASFIKFKKDNEGVAQGLDDLHVFQYEQPFGNYQDEMGTTNFPRIDLHSPSIIAQNNRFDCGLAAVANSMAFVKHYNDVLFTKAIMTRCLTTGRDVCYEITEDIFGLKSYFDRIMLDGQNTQHYLDLMDSMTLLMHMQAEFLDLVDKIAFDSISDDSITDVKFFEEVQKELEKHVLHSTSRKKPKEHAQSSQAKEESQTKPKKVLKTTRRSDCQEQKCKCLGDPLPIKKPPLKKPRQDRLSTQAKKEEKKKAEKEDADMLAYISQAICLADLQGCYHE